MNHELFHRFQSLKLLAYSDRLRAIAALSAPGETRVNNEGADLPFPIDWHIYPSNVCNHKCTWCMFRQDTPDGEQGEQFKYRVKLPRELLLRAVTDAHRTGAKLIHFSGGGEPLLNKHTIEAIRLANELKIETALSTNGRLLTPEIASLVDNVRVSLNAGTSKQHHKTNHADDPRDPGDWEIIVENIRQSVAHKKRDFGLGFVVDHENWQDIYSFCQLAAECGVDFVHIRPAFSYNKTKDKLTRSIMPHALVECNRAKRAFGDVLQIFSITEKFEGYWTPRTYDRCRAVLTGTVLCATGDFAVCQDRTDLRFGKQYSAGASFESVWGSEEHLSLVEKIVSPGLLDQCPRCVWNRRNEIIEHVFVKDEMRLNMI